MTDSPSLIIVSGLPADTPENRERVREIGVEDAVPWPKPYKDSTASACEHCEMPIWIGPQTFSALTLARATGGDPLILCLICCALLARENDADVSIIQLTDKKEGE